MSGEEASVSNEDAVGGDLKWVIAAVSAAGAMVVFRLLGPSWAIAFLAAEVALISIVIAQACDPFADAAQYIGETFKLPGSVRGATLDAVASSMPELFCGIFFVVLAISAAGTDDAAVVLAGAERYGATIATCAGSAVYDMILIPAFCAIFISYFRKDRPSIVIDDEVISDITRRSVVAGGIHVLRSSHRASHGAGDRHGRPEFSALPRSSGARNLTSCRTDRGGTSSAMR